MIYKWVEEIGEDREFLKTVINTCEDLYASHTMTLKEMAATFLKSDEPVNQKLSAFIIEDLLEDKSK